MYWHKQLCIIVLFMSSFFLTSCNPHATYYHPYKTGWQSGELQLTWSDQFLPIIYDLNYQLYLQNTDNSHTITILDRTKDSYYEFLPEQSGEFWLGVNAIKTYQEEDLLESPICWSNDTTCVNLGNIFKLKVRTINSDSNELIRWKIIWNNSDK